MSDSRLGAPVELPWWVIPLGIPPAVATILALVLTAALWARLLGVTVSLLTLLGLALIGGRVPSRNMQSVWISALYAIWVFVIVVWAVAVATPVCNCT